MWICVDYVKRGEIEASTKCVPPEKLLYGKNVRDALRKLGVTPNNFVKGRVLVHDEESDLKLSFPYHDYDEFERAAWYIRLRLIKEKKNES